MATQLPAPNRETAVARTIAVRGSSVSQHLDSLAGEDPMEIRAAGPGQGPVSVAVTMRTPGHDEELAAGFLYTEGLIGPGEIDRIEIADPGQVGWPDNHVTVHLRRRFDPETIAGRNFVATASCGICGKASLEAVEVRCKPLAPGPIVPREVVFGLPATLRVAQAIFESTGGLHAAGLFDPSGHLIAAREDVGRHNALDKLVGAMVLAGLTPLCDGLLLVSGRISFEIVQKAAVAGIPITCAVSAPTDLAVQAADRLGMTLIGFLRGEGFNVYSHPERLELGI